MGFACEEDARRVLDVLPKRFGKYGLTIHPDKTRLVPFVRPDRRPAATDPQAASQKESFDFLGFTHFWSQSQKGNWVVKRKTAGSRFHRALKRIGAWFRLNRHLPIREQGQTFIQKLRGHFAYYGGLLGNLFCLQRFRYEAVLLWRKWLSRRRRRGRLSWERFYRMLKRIQLPQPPRWVSPCAASP
jgi:RNA-directed DNA polymerase